MSWYPDMPTLMTAIATAKGPPGDAGANQVRVSRVSECRGLHYVLCAIVHRARLSVTELGVGVGSQPGPGPVLVMVKHNR